MTRWSSHSEATLQVSLDDVDWDMFRASSSDVSEFTEVALSFVNTLTEQATETVTNSEGTKESERQKSSRTRWDYWPRSEVLC